MINLILQFDLPYAEDGLNAYYTKSVHEIASDASNGRKLTPEEEERLLHEATPDDRTMLESRLPITHPYIVALRERWTINHLNDYQVFL